MSDEKPLPPPTPINRDITADNPPPVSPQNQDCTRDAKPDSPINAFITNTQRSIPLSPQNRWITEEKI